MNLSQRIRDYLAEHGPSTTAEVHVGLPDVKARNKIAMAIGSMRRAGMVEADGSTPARWGLARDVRLWKHATEGERQRAQEEYRRRSHVKRVAARAFERKNRGGTRSRAAFLAECAEGRVEIAQERLERLLTEVRQAQDVLERSRQEAAELRAAATADAEQRARAAEEREAARKARAEAAEAKRAAREAARKARAEAEETKRAAKRAARKVPARRAKPKPKPAVRKPVVVRPPVVTPKPPPVQKQEVPTMTVDEFLAQGGKVERVPAAWEREAA
ncbi:hypothetical protein LY625_03840 [Lysobacter sp. GX 14042]|uniref:hypothetical protein n=1 Tax=Lysobacter sp. GX 14042 TaxID=2907155 RepID=UPI001F343933|nr:hypothetical protein [Lysobacter sp. GX 14042]MCE7031756.1 hypothetical protein [Lysobacter sp. GX 14042]